MSDKVNTQNETEQEVVQEASKKEATPLEVYKVGHLKFRCHCCKHEYTIEENVQGGIRFDLYATNKHKLVLACPQCKATLEMFFEKGEDTGIVDIEGNPVPKGPNTKEETPKQYSEVEPEETVSQEDIVDEESDMEKEAEELPQEIIEEINNNNKEKADEIPIQEESTEKETV